MRGRPRDDRSEVASLVLRKEFQNISTNEFTGNSEQTEKSDEEKIALEIDVADKKDIFPSVEDTNETTNKGTKTMSRHESRVSGSVENGFYSLIVRIDKDGQENVIHGYKGRTFATREAGLKSTAKYMTKAGLK